mmetsp:Transcript_45376/g.73006  ORF Transcript_45376/g.73006 Transcript_45376/m.73006 type:complete len:102 (-) Transcript_45376:726-1031(-)
MLTERLNEGEGGANSIASEIQPGVHEIDGRDSYASVKEEEKEDGCMSKCPRWVQVILPWVAKLQELLSLLAFIWLFSVLSLKAGTVVGSVLALFGVGTNCL